MGSWGYVKLEDLVAEKGLVRGPFGGALKKEIFKASGYKVYEQRNAIYATTELGDYFIDEDKYGSLKRFAIKPGDFIVSCSGTIGRIFQVPDDAPNGVINQALLKITIDATKMLPAYFYQYFRWDKFQSEVVDNSQGGAMQNLVGMDIFRSTKLLVPDVTEQQRIVAVLEVWDEYLELLDKKITLKEQLRKGLMQQLLTGRKRLPGFAQEWQNIFFGETMAESRIKDIANDPRKRLTVRLHMKGVSVRAHRGTEALDSTQYFIRRAGQFIYGKQNIFRGSIGIVPDNLDGYASSQDIPAFDIKVGFNAHYLFYLVSRKNFYEWLENLTTGSGSKRLNPKELMRIKSKMPDIDEQNAITRVLLTADDEITRLGDKRNEILAQKKYLLKNLISGTIRTPENLQIKGAN